VSLNHLSWWRFVPINWIAPPLKLINKKKNIQIQLTKFSSWTLKQVLLNWTDTKIQHYSFFSSIFLLNWIHYKTSELTASFTIFSSIFLVYFKKSLVSKDFHRIPKYISSILNYLHSVQKRHVLESNKVNLSFCFHDSWYLCDQHYYMCSGCFLCIFCSKIY